MNTTLPIAVIGAGPVGLAAAAHLARSGRRLVIFEAGDAVAASVRDWGHVRMFSPWRYCIDAAARALLDDAGWDAPDADAVPTGGELIARYLEPLAALPAIHPHLRLGQRVVSVGRKDFDKVKTRGRENQPFAIEIETAGGGREVVEAAAVIDASGTWTRPNPIGSGGLPVPGERALADRVAYGIPDVLGAERAVYRDRTTMVVGSGHSAINVVLELVDLQDDASATRIIWAMRREDIEGVFGGGAADALPERGALGERGRRAVAEGRVEVLSPFRIGALARLPSGKIAVGGLVRELPVTVEVDRIVGATGFRPDFGPYSEIRLELDPWLDSAKALGPLIDPNVHSCGTVRPHGARELAHPEPDFYVAGIKSYGRAPTFLLATGHEQVRSIVAALNGDMEAAARVELVLPETGVCSAAPPIGKSVAGKSVGGGADAGCCGGPAPAEVDACCVTDAELKQAGGTGCGSAASTSAKVETAKVVPAPAASGGCCGPKATARAGD